MGMRSTVKHAELARQLTNRPADNHQRAKQPGVCCAEAGATCAGTKKGARTFGWTLPPDTFNSHPSFPPPPSPAPRTVSMPGVGQQ
eukprot:361197-Chlamydomonas_euryale.AAC.7